MSSFFSAFPLLIPILALMIPIVAILTAHQRRMAEIIHQNHDSGFGAEVQRLTAEVQALKELVLQQTLALDSAASRTLPPAPPGATGS